MTTVENAAPIPENWLWRSGPRPAGATVIFDVDGVLADACSTWP